MDFITSLGATSLSTALRAIVTLIICLIASKIITKIINTLLEKSKVDHTVCNVIRTVTKVGIWSLIVIIVADSLGISTASLVAVISIAGLALSLSVQDIMSNLFSGIVILIGKNFKKGDYVDIGATSGVIENVGLTHTAVKTLDNRMVNIPNKDVAGSAIVNYSSEPLRRVDMTFGADYNDPTNDVKAAINDAIAMDKNILSDPAPFVRISSYKDSTIEYVVRVWCRNADYWDVYFNLNENVRETFDKHNVHMSFNHINVHMIND